MNNKTAAAAAVVAVAIILIASYAVYSNDDREMSDDIVIVYTNDVHLNLDGNIGYAGLSAYVNDVRADHRYVALVDSGDYIQGSAEGVITQGSIGISIMKQVGYDMATIGNHEFDYGAERTWELLFDAGFEVLNCNITYTGSGEDKTGFLEDYVIKSYGATKIGFIGATTPSTCNESNPKNLSEDGRLVYDFCPDADLFYSAIQTNIDACVSAGASYVILLAHLGDSEYHPWTSVDVISNTTGLTAVLDGHEHKVIESMTVSDASGKSVILTSTGTGLQNIGCLTIASSGEVSSELIGSEYTKKDPKTAAYIAELKKEYQKALDTEIFKLEIDLSIYDSNGARTVRNQEACIGNLIADSMRTQTDSDIAVMNGGSIRASLEKGPVTAGKLIQVMPFLNTVAVVEVSGQKILDMLELSCYNIKQETAQGSAALGEFGGFLQVSGLKFKVDASIPTSVVLDEKGNFVKVSGDRRVSDVTVLDKTTGKYIPLSINSTYSLASNSYIILDCGNGYTMFKDCKVLLKDAMYDLQALVQYVQSLGDQINVIYNNKDGRIVRI